MLVSSLLFLHCRPLSAFLTSLRSSLPYRLPSLFPVSPFFPFHPGYANDPGPPPCHLGMVPASLAGRFLGHRPLLKRCHINAAMAGGGGVTAVQIPCSTLKEREGGLLLTPRNPCGKGGSVVNDGHSSHHPIKPRSRRLFPGRWRGNSNWNHLACQPVQKNKEIKTEVSQAEN